MVRFLATPAAVFAAAFAVTPAAAQNILNSYVQVHGGVFGQTGDELSVEAIGAADEPIRAVVDTDPDIGFAAGGLIGYGIGLGLAIEGEITYRSNDFSAAGTLPAIFPGPLEGTAETAAFMVNGVYQITVPFVAAPYVGVGVGYLTPLGDTDDFDGEFAYQAKAGLAWPVGVGRIITEVHYLGTSGLTDGDGVGAELDYGGISGHLGYRFGF